MQSIKGFHIIDDNELNQLEGVLNEWCHLVDQYSLICKGDAAYWYTEMSLTSLFSSAAWRTGYVSLIEFQTEKGAKYRPKNLGRGDIYIANTTEDFHIESKFGLPAWNNFAKKAAEMHAKAMIDAKNTSGKEEFPTLGMTFISPYIKGTPENIENEINTLVSSLPDIANTIGAEGWAWAFPLSSNADWVCREGVNGYTYPGVVMFLTKYRKTTKPSA